MTSGSWSQQDIELVQEIGRRISAITEDSRERVFLLQRLTMALQRGNTVSFLIGKKVKERIAVNGTPSHSYGVSLAVSDHTVLPSTRHK